MHVSLSSYIRPAFLLCSLAFLSAACGSASPGQDTATPALAFVTSTLPPAVTPLPSETPPPPAPQPTIPAAEGLTSTQVNVRAEPSTASKVLGIIPVNTKVQIIGKDSAGNWWQIVYPQGEEGKGWVTAQYVTMAGKFEVPMIGSLGVDQGSSSAVVIQKLNVRSGPGTDLSSLGTLEPNDVVKLTGKNNNSTWLQIEFAPGPEGKGWISAAFVQARGVENLPIVTEAGQIIGTGTPTGIPPTSTPTLIPAVMDGDSPRSPGARASLGAGAGSALQYSSDISSPEGDAEDWVQFLSFSSVVYLQVDCIGNGDITLELWQNDAPVQGFGTLTCGGKQWANVSPGQAYLVRLQANPASGLQYVHFTLLIAAAP